MSEQYIDSIMHGAMKDLIVSRCMVQLWKKVVCILK